MLPAFLSQYNAPKVRIFPPNGSSNPPPHCDYALPLPKPSRMFPRGIAMASSTSPGQSSPESLDVEDDSTHPPTQWQPHDNENTSPEGNGASSSQQQQQPRPTAPMQKRRRVTRACDECRRKKIKCDGKQPCTHCTVYSYGMAFLIDRLIRCNGDFL